MISALFYIAGAATVGIFFTSWCVVSVERVKKEYEASRYGILCDRIQEQIDEIRLRIAVTKTQLNVDIDTKNIDLEEYVSMQKKSIADMRNVSEEKVIPISRLEYETYTDE